MYAQAFVASLQDAMALRRGIFFCHLAHCSDERETPRHKAVASSFVIWAHCSGERETPRHKAVASSLSYELRL
jgi:hypothetical protein